MYKSGLLSHLARASRQHPFFTQNVNGANSTALSLVKPKLGLATERAYFSSWGGNGATGSSSSQTALIAISNDDNQLWDKDIGLHRKQFHLIAGIRRYSTGTRTEGAAEGHAGTLQLTGTPGEQESLVFDGEESGGTTPPTSDLSPDPATQVARAELTEFEESLESLLQSNKYSQVVEVFDDRLQLSAPLSTRSFNTFFRTLSAAYEHYGPADQSWVSYEGADALFHYYGIMLEKQIRPDFATYETLLTFLQRLALDGEDQRTVLKHASCFQGTPQDAFFDVNRDRLARLGQSNVDDLAIQIFHASVAVRDQPYKMQTLVGLLAACNRLVRTDDAVAIYDYVDRMKLPKTAELFHGLLNVFISAKDLPGAIECFNSWKLSLRSMTQHHYWVIYSLLVRCYFAAGDISGAMEFFYSAATQSRKVSPRSYLSVVQCFASVGRYEEGYEFALKNLNAGPNIFSSALGELVDEANNRGDYAIARSYFSQITSISAFAEYRHRPWAHLQALISEGQLDDLMQFLRTCARQQINMRLAPLSLLISRLLDAGRVEDALEIANLVGTRRLVWDANEMNKAKLALYCDILVNDFVARDVIDDKLLPALAESVLMAGRAPRPETVARFLNFVREKEFSKVLSSETALLYTLCRIATLLEEKARGTADGPRDNNIQAQSRVIVAWLLQTLQASPVGLQVSNSGNEYIESLKIFAQSLGLDAEVEALWSARSSPDAPRSSEHRQLPPARLIFKSQFDASLDKQLSSDVTQALLGTHSARQFKHHRAYMTSEQVIELFKTHATTPPERSIVPETLLLAFSQFGRHGTIEDLRELYQVSENLLPGMVQSPDCIPAARAFIHDLAISSFNEQNDSAAAQQCHDQVLALGFIPSANAYASFIAKINEDEYRDGASRALALFYEARSFGVKPNEYLFNTVIAKLARARRNDDALEHFEEMKSLGLRPNGVTYGTVINSCCRVGLTEKAEALLVEMERLPKAHSKIAPYNTLIQHFVQTRKDRSKAFYYWEKLQARAIPPTAHSYRLLIEAHGHLEPVDPVAAEGVIELMRATGSPVTSIHIAAIIHMYGVVLNDYVRARQYFDQWTTGSHQRRRPDNVLYQSMIEAAVQAKDIDGMRVLLQQMKDSDIPLNAYIVNLAIDGYGHNDQLDEARQLFDQLPASGAGSKGKEPSTYETMIKAYNGAAQGEKSVEILDLMKSQGYPDAVLSRVSALVPHAP